MRDPLEEVGLDRGRAITITVAMAVAAAVLVAVNATLFFTVAVILAFFVMIMLHELAHYLAAKRTGMKVTEFFVGFGPRLWSFHRGETEYGLKAVPLGGYCKIIGMTNLDDVESDDEPRAYRSKPYLSRVLVAGAGSAMHFAIAFVLMFTVLWIGGDYPHAEITTEVGAVVAGSGAQEAGLQEGDELVSIGGDPVEEWDDVPRIVRATDAETLDFVLVRDGETLTVPVDITTCADIPECAEAAPQAADPDEALARRFAGIGPGVYVPPMSAWEAARATPGEVVGIAGAAIGALGDMFSPSGVSNYFGVLSGDESADDTQRFVSPVGFGKLATDAVRAGWVEVMGLLIAINVFVGLFNLVPLLPFDGGHIAIATYEQIASTIRGRRVRVDVAKLIPVTAVVVALLGFIFLSSLFLDVSDPIENPF